MNSFSSYNHIQYGVDLDYYYHNVEILRYFLHSSRLFDIELCTLKQDEQDLAF